MVESGRMKPKNPFLVAGYRGPEWFCDREAETERVLSALDNERNLTLVAPRRYGKTGLVRNVMHRLGGEWASVYVDIYATSNLREFTEAFAGAVVGALDTAADKVLSAVGRFFKFVRPTVTPDGTGGVSLSFSVEPQAAERTLSDVFDYIASKDRRVAVAIDEFQQIREYPERGTEALLRGKIQFCENANFIFAGSRHHVLSDMFTSPKAPFYQSADILSLDVIPVDRYAAFAKRFFDGDGRPFSESAFETLWRRFDGITWYVQAVLNRIWGEGGGLGAEADADSAVSSLVEERGLTFHDLLAGQTGVGKKLLKAVADERCVPEMTAGAFLRKHGFAAPSSVRAAMPALVDHDLLYRTDAGHVVYDRLFAEWLRRQP